MDVLSDELRELGGTSRRLLERLTRTSPLPPSFGTPAGLDRELWSSLAGLGLLGLAVPEELGGSGGGATELCVLAEQMGAALPAVPFAGTAAVAAVLVTGADDAVARQVLAERRSTRATRVRRSRPPPWSRRATRPTRQRVMPSRCTAGSDSPGNTTSTCG
jgi:alkylation response protein AidB-like acyl-CoA dehydrogenase